MDILCQQVNLESLAVINTPQIIESLAREARFHIASACAHKGGNTEAKREKNEEHDGRLDNLKEKRKELKCKNGRKNERMRNLQCKPWRIVKQRVFENQ
jgi:predicted nuclease with TOPRIM domain